MDRLTIHGQVKRRKLVPSKRLMRTKDYLLDLSTEWIGVRLDKEEGKASILILPGKIMVL